jgi:hypothetical protein
MTAAVLSAWSMLEALLSGSGHALRIAGPEEVGKSHLVAKLVQQAVLPVSQRRPSLW